MMQRSTESLQSRIDSYGSATSMLRNSSAGPYVFPITSEYSNWREEQRAWREEVALLDLSFHMSDIYLEGPEVRDFVSSLAVNSFSNFGANKAKQFVACAPSGYLIGDMIVLGLSDQLVNIVGRPTVANWIDYQASLGNFDVTCQWDARSVDNESRRRIFRFQIQGPKAWSLLEKLNGKPIDQPRFFQMGALKVGKHDVQSLRHGMGGAPGLEIWGPFELYDEIRDTITAAGREFGLRLVGARAYSTTPVESGWLANPLPAIYAGEENRGFREWLPATSYEGVASLAGSFQSDSIEDYFFTPWDLDYGRVIRFDHDFVGREALENMKDERHRKKVSLVLDPDDTAAVFRSQMSPGQNGKAMELPTAHYGSYQYDTVIGPAGNQVGVSTYMSFIHPDGALVSLAVVDEDFAEEGKQVSIIWGEPEGSPKRPAVEEHLQMEVKATVSTWPFSKQARSGYRPA